MGCEGDSPVPLPSPPSVSTDNTLIITRGNSSRTLMYSVSRQPTLKCNALSGVPLGCEGDSSVHHPPLPLCLKTVYLKIAHYSIPGSITLQGVPPGVKGIPLSYSPPSVPGDRTLLITW